LTRMTSAAEARRESFENGLAAVMHAQKRLQFVALRVDQALQFGGVRVLNEAVEDLNTAFEKLNFAQQEFGDVWKDADWENG
jgi:hypothetical protein